MRIVQSFPAPRPTTNPYVVQLLRHLQTTADVEVRTFSWRTVLLGRYDIVHLHWPETLLVATTAPRRLRRELQVAAWVLRLFLTRTAVVRTVHNVGLPAGLSRRDTLLLRALDRRTTLRVRLNPLTETPAGAPVATILHGHYRDWLAGLPHATTVPGRLAFVGQVRRYKGVERLVDAYADGRELLAALSLEIGGRPTSTAVEDDLRDRVRGLADVSVRLDHLDDADVVGIVTAAELVVLPYRFMHNSGTVLYALSLGRPVLVPDNAVNRLLADEVGPGWVHVFDGELDGRVLVTTLERLRASPPRAAPELSARDWSRGGAAHEAAYRQALEVRR